MKNWKTLKLLKQINENTKNWHEEHLQEMKCLKNSIQSFRETQNAYQNHQETSFLTPKGNQENYNQNFLSARINSKDSNKLKTETNVKIINKCHMTEQIQNLNIRIQAICGKQQNISKSNEKVELFSLNKQIFHKENRKTFSLNPSDLIFRNKILSEIPFKKKEFFEKFLKERREIESCHENCIKTTRQQINNQIRQSSLHEKYEKDRISSDMTLKKLKQIFNL